MVEDFPQNKILKYLTLTILVVSLVILINEIILKPKILSIPEIPSRPPEIEIDFEVLESQKLKELLPFEKIASPEEIGRENPFEPY